MERWLKPCEAAEKLRISRSGLAGLIRCGILVQGVHFTHPRGIGRRFRESKLDDYLACVEKPEEKTLRVIRGRVNLGAVA